MSSVSKEELKNLKKLIANIEELIKLNVDFQKRLEMNSRPSVNVTSNILKAHKKQNKESSKATSKATSKAIKGNKSEKKSGKKSKK